MTTQNANPSLDPSNNGTLAGMANVVMKKLMQGIDGILPAKVIAYKGYPDNVVQVQPLINLLNTNNQEISRAQIAQIPVCQIGSGGFLLRFNLNPGDMGLILANDRDISLFTETWSQSAPNTMRIKSFSDSVFLPLAFTNVTVNAEDVSNMTLQTEDGSIRIALSSLGIKITGDVEIVGGLSVTGGITGNMEISGNLKVDGRMVGLGDIASGGNITAAGTITPDTPIPP